MFSFQSHENGNALDSWLKLPKKSQLPCNLSQTLSYDVLGYFFLLFVTVCYGENLRRTDWTTTMPLCFEVHLRFIFLLFSVNETEEEIFNFTRTIYSHAIFHLFRLLLKSDIRWFSHSTTFKNENTSDKSARRRRSSANAKIFVKISSLNRR